MNAEYNMYNLQSQTRLARRGRIQLFQLSWMSLRVHLAPNVCGSTWSSVRVHAAWCCARERTGTNAAERAAEQLLPLHCCLCPYSTVVLFLIPPSVVARLATATQLREHARATQRQDGRWRERWWGRDTQAQAPSSWGHNRTEHAGARPVCTVRDLAC